jgi:hypothetical protein
LCREKMHVRDVEGDVPESEKGESWNVLGANAAEIQRETRSPALPTSGSVGNPDHRNAWEEMGRSGIGNREARRAKIVLRELTERIRQSRLHPVYPDGSRRPALSTRFAV